MRNEPEFLFLNITLNVTSEDEHEPYIERFNRTLKEQCCMCFATLPFKNIPHLIVAELVSLQIFWLKFFIPRYYISLNMGPSTIIAGQTYDYDLLLGRVCQEEDYSYRGNQYGKYIQTHKATDNTMKVRTAGALTMRPTGNAQGSFYYFLLATGCRLHRHHCTPLPIPSTTIDRVHTMATKQKIPME